MKDRNRLSVLGGLLVVLAVVLAVVLRGGGKPPATASDGQGIYYTGPRRAKWDPNVWVTDDGKIVPPPPGAQKVPVPEGGGGGRGMN